MLFTVPVMYAYKNQSKDNLYYKPQNLAKEIYIILSSYKTRIFMFYIPM